MEYSTKPASVTPRIIIHGGAGNITRENMPRESYHAYRKALLRIVRSAHDQLKEPHSSALDVATFAVSMLEDNTLFNAGRGAVYTTAGTHELEASVMVSKGYRKRGVGVMKVRQAKSPIKLAREMLIRGELPDGGGAQGHCQLEGETIDRLAEEWGLELTKPSYFWTRKRWDEHRRGLGLRHDDETYERQRREADEEHSAVLPEERKVAMVCDEALESEPGWDGAEYLPQGTVGAVVLDSTGTLAVATSTGGLTNKLPGRIGDTPTLGAGFWAEAWEEATPACTRDARPWADTSSALSFVAATVHDCLWVPKNIAIPYDSLPATDSPCAVQWKQDARRAVAMSGTGNGDSFLRLNAVRTAAAMPRYGTRPGCAKGVSLQQAVTAVAGPHGQLQQSAGHNWHRSGEGEGGIIGIELVQGQGRIAFDYNCGGMFHAWIDDDGQAQFALFHDAPRPPP